MKDGKFKILVVNSDCIQVNSSANLCHLAYIKGMVDAGHAITLLSADGRDYTTDSAMMIPSEIESYTYYGVSLYEKMSLKKQKENSVTHAVIPEEKKSKSVKREFIKKMKHLFLSLYGPHGIYITFVRNAVKFRSDTDFDYVISLATPPSSHLLVYKLLKKKHIKAKQWIQIWEDPWWSDAYGFNGKKAIYKEEKRLLSFAEKVCYVSPLTLRNQQRIYPEAAHKMFWQPLPYYYKNEEPATVSNDVNFYGYFGDYMPAARNLKPFYDAACETQINVNICGRPSDLFASTETVHIHPRLSLDELRPIEEKTNVLIFLCNRKGGQIPGKIYQYSATNKTVLFILDGTEEEQDVLQGYFAKFNRYVFCQNTKEDIMRAIKLIEEKNFGTVRNVPVEEFNPQDTIRKILDCENGD